MKSLCLGNFDNQERIQQNIYNRFYGSLEPLRNMNKLEGLSIENLDIDRGLEYLPKSIEWIECSFNQGSEFRVSDIWDELQPFKGGYFGEKLNSWRKIKLDKQLSLTASSLLPPQLLGKEAKQKELQKEEKKKKFATNIQKLKYDKMHFNQWGESNFSVPENLPIRLYDIKSEQDLNTSSIEKLKKNVKETNQWEEKKKYATLSYLWGECKDEINYDKDGKFINLTPKGRKALTKAIKACELLEIDYLWIDQLCINQNKSEEGKTERGREVPKMRQYYGDAEVTLVAIDEEVGNLKNIDLMDILIKIINSEWFTRSWTFQEGWLSKHTVFMFDDKLIDGWAMAGTWALNQLSYVEGGKYDSRREFNKGSKKIATPIGWTYYRNGYDENDKVEMSLNQALRAVKNRKRFLPIDGVYSILGLLPYGEKVKVDYNLSPQNALYNVMEIALDNRIIEPLAWHGSGSSLIPKMDEHGSTSIEGVAEVRVSANMSDNRGGVNFTKKNIEFSSVAKYLIVQDQGELYKTEGGFEVDSGLYSKEVKVEPKEPIGCKENYGFTATILGTKETLELATKGKSLLIFDQQSGGYQYLKPFALLAEDTKERYVSDFTISGAFGKQGSVYQRLGLVELGNSEKFVDANADNVIMIKGFSLNQESKPTEQLLQENILEISSHLHSGFTFCSICSKLKDLWKGNKKAEQKLTDWQNIHPNLTPDLIQNWQNLNFNYQQTQDWINIGLNLDDYEFANWLRDTKSLTSEQTLNHHLEELKREFEQSRQNNQQPQIIQTNLPKNN